MREPYGAPRRLEASGGNPARLVEAALKIRDQFPFALRPGHRLDYPAPKEDLEPVQQAGRESFGMNLHFGSATLLQAHRGPRFFPVNSQEEHGAIGGKATALFEGPKPASVVNTSIHLHIQADVSQGRSLDTRGAAGRNGKPKAAIQPA